MREAEFLRERYRAMFASLGVILLLTGGLTLVPLLLLITYPEELPHAPAFLIPATMQMMAGGVLWRWLRFRNMTLAVAEGGVVATLSWIVVILFSAIPFIMIEGLHFQAAVFESTSGWTATGMTVINVDMASPMTLFWRSFLQYIGGAGLAIIMLSALVGVAGTGITNAEGREHQLLPQVHKSAQLVLIIYLVYGFCGTLALTIAGMPWFDAMNHAFTAIATGGFSSVSGNFSVWNSLVVEVITIVLMLLGSLSFLTAWMLLRGQFRAVINCAEVQYVLVVLPVSVLLLAGLTFMPVYGDFLIAFRHACFEAASVITTTGFSTVPFSTWNSFGIALMIVLMVIGGGTCSTAGGIKQVRACMVLSLIRRELRQMTHPRNEIIECSIPNGRHRLYIDDVAARRCLIFVMLYLLTIVAGTLVVSACGFSFTDSLFEVTAAMTSMGTTNDTTSAEMPLPAIWTLIVTMVLGRLEILVVFAAFMKLAADTRQRIRLTRR